MAKELSEILKNTEKALKEMSNKPNEEKIFIDISNEKTRNILNEIISYFSAYIKLFPNADYKEVDEFFDRFEVADLKNIKISNVLDLEEIIGQLAQINKPFSQKVFRAFARTHFFAAFLIGGNEKDLEFKFLKEVYESRSDSNFKVNFHCYENKGSKDYSHNRLFLWAFLGEADFSEKLKKGTFVIEQLESETPIEITENYQPFLVKYFEGKGLQEICGYNIEELNKSFLDYIYNKFYQSDTLNWKAIEKYSALFLKGGLKYLAHLKMLEFLKIFRKEPKHGLEKLTPLFQLDAFKEIFAPELALLYYLTARTYLRLAQKNYSGSLNCIEAALLTRINPIDQPWIESLCMETLIHISASSNDEFVAQRATRIRLDFYKRKLEECVSIKMDPIPFQLLTDAQCFVKEENTIKTGASDEIKAVTDLIKDVTDLFYWELIDRVSFDWTEKFLIELFDKGDIAAGFSLIKGYKGSSPSKHGMIIQTIEKIIDRYSDVQHVSWIIQAIGFYQDGLNKIGNFYNAAKLNEYKRKLNQLLIVSGIDLAHILLNGYNALVEEKKGNPSLVLTHEDNALLSETLLNRLRNVGLTEYGSLIKLCEHYRALPKSNEPNLTSFYNFVDALKWINTGKISSLMQDWHLYLDAAFFYGANFEANAEACKEFADFITLLVKQIATMNLTQVLQIFNTLVMAKIPEQLADVIYRAFLKQTDQTVKQFQTVQLDAEQKNLIEKIRRVNPNNAHQRLIVWQTGLILEQSEQNRMKNFTLPLNKDTVNQLSRNKHDDFSKLKLAEDEIEKFAEQNKGEKKSKSTPFSFFGSNKKPEDIFKPLEKIEYAQAKSLMARCYALGFGTIKDPAQAAFHYFLSGIVDCEQGQFANHALLQLNQLKRDNNHYFYILFGFLLGDENNLALLVNSHQLIEIGKIEGALKLINEKIIAVFTFPEHKKINVWEKFVKFKNALHDTQFKAQIEVLPIFQLIDAAVKQLPYYLELTSHSYEMNSEQTSVATYSEWHGERSIPVETEVKPEPEPLQNSAIPLVEEKNAPYSTPVVNATPKQNEQDIGDAIKALINKAVEQQTAPLIQYIQGLEKQMQQMQGQMNMLNQTVSLQQAQILNLQQQLAHSQPSAPPLETDTNNFSM